jgi:hypothetical protein
VYFGTSSICRSVPHDQHESVPHISSANKNLSRMAPLVRVARNPDICCLKMWLLSKPFIHSSVVLREAHHPNSNSRLRCFPATQNFRYSTTALPAVASSTSTAQALLPTLQLPVGLAVLLQYWLARAFASGVLERDRAIIGLS